MNLLPLPLESLPPLCRARRMIKIAMVVTCCGLCSTVPAVADLINFNLGRTYTVPNGVTFNQVEAKDYLVGTLNVQGRYNLFGSGFFPHLYVNNLNISGAFNNNGGTIVNSTGYYYNNFDIVIGRTGVYNQTGGFIWHSVDSITNQGTFLVSGGNIDTPVFHNAGTLTIGAAARFGTQKLSNTGLINADRSVHFSDITDLDISNGVVTDIRGKPGLVIDYADSPANEYLGHNDYLLSGPGGLLTHFQDVVSVTSDSPYSLTLGGGYHLSFDFWWDTGINTPPPQPGYELDVLARLDGSEWQSIGQITADTSSTGWNTALFLLAPDLRDAGTQIRFVLSDQPPGTARAIYLRAFATPDTGGTALMAVISLAITFLLWHWQRRRLSSHL